MDRNVMINLLREAAAGLEAEKDATVLFPGWYEPEEDDALPRHRDIRDAAEAVLADGLNYDQGIRVNISAVGALVRYLADMMEE